MISFSKKGIWLSACLIGIASCVKDPQDIPPEFAGNAVFRLEGTWNGENIAIEAGVKNWTAVPATQHQDSAVIYTSVFSVDGCQGQCSPSWVFNFYQALPAFGDAESEFRQTIRQGNIDLALSDLERSGYEISVGTHPDLLLNGFNYWVDLNNPQDSIGSEFSSTLGYDDTLHLCFHAATYLGCQYNQCITYTPSTQVPCLGFIQSQLESEQYLSMMVRPEGTGPFQIEWMTGETSQRIIVPVEDSIAAIYAGVLVTDANGNQTEIDQIIRVNNGYVDACYYPITLTSELQPNSIPEAIAGDLEIMHTDETGTVWRSTAGIQPSDANAYIDEVVYFGESPFGEKAYVVSLTAKAWLTNSLTGESRWFEVNDLVIPLSHKD